MSKALVDLEVVSRREDCSGSDNKDFTSLAMGRVNVESDDDCSASLTQRTFTHSAST